MSQAPTLKLVANLQAVSEVRDDSAIIATTEPKPFLQHFELLLGRSIFVFDTGRDAIAHCSSCPPKYIFADFRSLADNWSGQKLLRFVRSERNLEGVQFHLMAHTWLKQQEQWAIRCGAVGFVSRDPAAVAKLVSPAGCQEVKGNERPELDAVDAIFGRLAGPMRYHLIEEVRAKIADGTLASTVEAYVAALADLLSLPERRDQFLSDAGSVIYREQKSGTKKARADQ